ncbi:NLRC3, partial [Symbiodinium necroappetens]
ALASSQRRAAVQLHISGNLTNLEWHHRVKARLMDVVVALDTWFRVARGDKSTAHDKAQEVRQALRDGHVEIFWLQAGRKELAAALQGQSRLQVLQVDQGKDVEAVLEALEGHVALKSLVLCTGIDGYRPLAQSRLEAFGFALDGKSGLEELVLQDAESTFIGPQGMQ